MFTWNSPSLDGPALLSKFTTDGLASYLRYAVYQLEEAPTSGTPHLQGYTEFSRPVRMAAVKKFFGAPSLHLEPRFGTRQQAYDYCTKELTRTAGPWEFGVFDAGGRGRRSDLADVAEIITSGGTVRDVAEAHPIAYIKYCRGIKALSYTLTARTRVAPTVALFYGPTGTGKTKTCFDRHSSELYIKEGNGKWFDGYEKHSVVVMDDFAGRASATPLSTLLRWLDRYPVQVETKGGHAWLLATRIVITTNLHPRTWYDYATRSEHYAALARRIHEVYWYTEFGVPGRRLDKQSFFDDWWEGCSEGDVFSDYIPPVTATVLQDDSSEESHLDCS